MGRGGKGVMVGVREVKFNGDCMRIIMYLGLWYNCACLVQVSIAHLAHIQPLSLLEVPAML